MYKSEPSDHLLEIVPTRRDVHILCMEGGWICTTAGTDEIYFDNLSDAEDYGRTIARREESKFFVHTEHGEIIIKECYQSGDVVGIAS